jgi:hypothetical protein
MEPSGGPNTTQGGITHRHMMRGPLCPNRGLGIFPDESVSDVVKANNSRTTAGKVPPETILHGLVSVLITRMAKTRLDKVPLRWVCNNGDRVEPHARLGLISHRTVRRRLLLGSMEQRHRLQKLHLPQILVPPERRETTSLGRQELPNAIFVVRERQRYLN